MINPELDTPDLCSNARCTREHGHPGACHEPTVRDTVPAPVWDTEAPTLPDLEQAS